jgi:hypothetical protein
MNLTGSSYFPPSVECMDERITLPVFVGEVVGTGSTLEEAIADAETRLLVAQQFAAEAIRVRREILMG